MDEITNDLELPDGIESLITVDPYQEGAGLKTVYVAQENGCSKLIDLSCPTPYWRKHIGALISSYWHNLALANHPKWPEGWPNNISMQECSAFLDKKEEWRKAVTKAGHQSNLWRNWMFEQ